MTDEPSRTGIFDTIDSMSDKGVASALIVVDVQVGVVAEAWERDQILARIGEVVDKARHHGTPVVWVRHSDENLKCGSENWQIVPELVPLDGDAIVEKHYGDSFEDTDLSAVLMKHQVGQVVVCGAQSDACVISTCFGAFVRGYDVTLVGDAHTAQDWSAYGAPGPDQVVNMINMIWQYRDAPGRTAAVTSTATVRFD